jgi:hypothetical protein
MALTTFCSNAGACDRPVLLLLLLLLVLLQLLIYESWEQLCQLQCASSLLLPSWLHNALLLQLLQCIPEC